MRVPSGDQAGFPTPRAGSTLVISDPSSRMIAMPLSSVKAIRRPSGAQAGSRPVASAVSLPPSLPITKMLPPLW